MKQIKILLFGLLILLSFSCKNKTTNVDLSKSAEMENPHVFINDSINGIKLGASVQECSNALEIWEKSVKTIIPKKICILQE